MQKPLTGGHMSTVVCPRCGSNSLVSGLRVRAPKAEVGPNEIFVCKQLSAPKRWFSLTGESVVCDFNACICTDCGHTEFTAVATKMTLKDLLRPTVY